MCSDRVHYVQYTRNCSSQLSVASRLWQQSAKCPKLCVRRTARDVDGRHHQCDFNTSVVQQYRSEGGAPQYTVQLYTTRRCKLCGTVLDLAV